jgi:hypothetical protein
LILDWFSWLIPVLASVSEKFSQKKRLISLKFCVGMLFTQAALAQETSFSKSRDHHWSIWSVQEKFGENT